MKPDMYENNEEGIYVSIKIQSGLYVLKTGNRTMILMGLNTWRSIIRPMSSLFLYMVKRF